MQKKIEKKKCDILIVGAGVIGSSVAMNLALHEKNQLKPRKICVIDFDLEGTFSSSELNAGGVRSTFFNEINAVYSKKTIEYLEKYQEEVGYRKCGYLWLYSEEKAKLAREQAYALWKKIEWPFEILDFNKLRKKIPFIDKSEGIEEIVFSPRDGLVNPNRLKNHYREKAIQNGVTFEDRIWVTAAELENKKITLETMRFYNKPLELSDKKNVLTDKKFDLQGRKIFYESPIVINCAGAWAPKLANLLGYHVPSVPVRRQVCLFDSQDVDLSPYGMIVDTSGVYFHPEATHGLAGFANADEPAGLNFEYDSDSFFMEKIWPALYERSTAFERLKHITGWSGLYEVSPDHSSILGLVETGSPAQNNTAVYDAHSFSGHGVMHSYAAGLVLAEQIFTGSAHSLPLEPLSGKRFENNQTVAESLVI